MTKYIAKPDTWFNEGTKCILQSDFRDGNFNIGLFRGTYTVGPNEGYDKFWHKRGHKEGDQVEMNEVCNFDEFDIVETDE